MDLELVETNDLLDEILKRFDHAVFAGQKNIDGGDDYEIWRHQGNYRIGQGLANGILHRINKRLDEISEPAEGDS